MRKAWPGFRGFGHVKQFLNPAGYPAFRRRLKGVTAAEDGVSRTGSKSQRTGR